MSGAAAGMVWFVLGAIVGVIWTRIAPTRSSQAGLANVAVGGTGAMVGGALTLVVFGSVGAAQIAFAFPVAFASAALSLLAFKAVAGRQRGAPAA